MLTLTRIWLYNWHRFADHLLDVEDSLYLAGHNGSGKSSVLDALQVVLISHQDMVRFNSAANDRGSQRSLDTYVRGKIGEGRYMRPGNTVAYLALEFRERSRDLALTVGVCIECGEGRGTERTHFILGEGLDRGLFLADGRPLTRRDLKALLRSRRGARSYDTVGEYQVELLNRLGGLHERFFELLRRALTFQPIRNIREFVERWLLEGQPLAIEALQRVVERLNELDASAREVEEKLAALQALVNRQMEVRRLRELHATWQLLGLLLTETVAARRVAALQQQQHDTARRISQVDQAKAQAESAFRHANEALVEIRVQLQQSDVVRRRSELERQLRDGRAALERMVAERRSIFKGLAGVTQILQPLLDVALLAEERTELADFVACVAALDAQEPPPANLVATIFANIQALELALKRVQHSLFSVTQEQQSLKARLAEVQQQLERLRRGQKSYPPEVERLRDLLVPIVGSRPPLLCELLEVPDEQWQNAVEALLGRRRFTIIVPPEHFDAALRRLDQARAQERLTDAALLDLERAAREGRPAQQHSLAQQVQAKTRRLAPYLNAILGDIICCAEVGDLRRHRRAVTAEVVLYSEWTVRALAQRSYEPWFVGARAIQSQLALCEREQAELTGQLAQLGPQVRDLQALEKSLKQDVVLSNLAQRLEAELDDRPLLAQLAEDEAELHNLDLSGVRALETEADRLAAVVEQERKLYEGLIAELARLQDRAQALEHELQSARHAQLEAETQAAEATQQASSELAAQADKLLQERLANPDLSEVLRNAEATMQRYQTSAQNELTRLVAEGTTYNMRYQFAGNHDPEHESFPREFERLQATELPRYREQIAQASRQADEELREHVLHRLREQILGARQQLGRINDALNRLDFHGERYRFVNTAAEDLREYYDLINEAQVIGAGSLFESNFYSDHKDAFDRFYEALTRTPQSNAEREEQQRLTDYRSYLDYDIEVTHPGGQVSRLSRIMGQTSGGETQTPFYLTIAASFVQLYHIGERTNRPTIRLVVFDEAFSKMDQDRIGATLDLFQHFGLQVVTATPLERCEYLVPKMCTSLVLTGVGDTVLVEPYRNYAARLESA